MRIRVDTEVLRDKAYQLDEQLDKLSDGINIIKSLLFDTDGDWQGESQRAFALKIFEMGNGFLETEAALREISTEMKRQAEEFENAENKAAALLIF